MIAVLDVVKAYIEADILQNAVEAFCDSIRSSIGVEWPIPTEDIIAFCLRNYSDPSTVSFYGLKSLVNGEIPGLSLDDPVAIFDFAAFFEKFEAEAVDGVVKKEKCADMATGCIRFAIQEKMKNDLSSTVDQRVAYFNAILASPMSGLDVRIQIKPELVQELLSATMINLQGKSFWAVHF